MASVKFVLEREIGGGGDWEGEGKRVKSLHYNYDTRSYNRGVDGRGEPWHVYPGQLPRDDGGAGSGRQGGGGGGETRGCRDEGRPGDGARLPATAAAGLYAGLPEHHAAVRQVSVSLV